MKCISITYNTSYYIYKFRMNLVKELQNIYKSRFVTSLKKLK